MDRVFMVPDELRFAVTRRCDGACRHCYNLSGRDSESLPATEFTRIIGEVRSLNPGLDRITLTGGEPMNEVEKTLQITRFAHSLGIRVRLVTRGWELTAALCGELKDAGVSILQIGLDSSGKYGYTDRSGRNWDTFHSWLRGDAQGFAKSEGAIRLAIEAGMDVSVRYSLCQSNLPDVAETYLRVSGLGASKFKFRVLFPDGRAKKRLQHELIGGAAMARAQHALIEASRGRSTVVEITQPCLFNLPGRLAIRDEEDQPNAFREACPCGTEAAYVDANGDVKYCLFDEQVLGNTRDGGFLKAWNSPAAAKARHQRCPLDKSGSACSSFKILYGRFNDYARFMHDYGHEVAILRLPRKNPLKAVKI